MMKRFLNVLMLLVALGATAVVQTSCTENPDMEENVIKEGYVRHVILWTLDETLSPEEKQQVIAIAEEAMTQFLKEIPGLVKAEVVYENRLTTSNCDFMFDMYFSSRQALEDFSVNPKHLAVVAQLKPFITGRACLDVEL